MIKNILSNTPQWFQNKLKALNYSLQIKKNKFTTDEIEFDELDKFVNEGDWVIDVGANVGHYTYKLSQLVGASGRVFSFEPIPNTFSHLVNNSLKSKYKNITLFNAAVSESTSLAGMSIPYYESGLKDFYRAAINSNNTSTNDEYSVLTLSIDQLNIEHKISLIKIDAEEHEPFVFRGLRKILTRDKPIIIVETVTSEITSMLDELGYRDVSYDNSHNKVFRI